MTYYSSSPHGFRFVLAHGVPRPEFTEFVNYHIASNSFEEFVANLPAGNHTVKLQAWGNITIYANANPFYYGGQVPKTQALEAMVFRPSTRPS